MYRTSLCLGLLAGLAIAGPCFAHFFPAKAVSLKASLVQGYPPCTAPNVMTSGGRPACLATSETDPDCVFGTKGVGSLAATISKTNVKLSMKLKGIQQGQPSCEGVTLAPTLTVRTTTDDCAEDHCTVMDYELSGPSCVVKNGKCTASGTIPTGYPAGAGSEMTVVTCGVQTDGKTVFDCGIMVK
jgi:hypothetical protein